MILRRYQPADLIAMQRIAIEGFAEVSIDRKMQQRFGILGETDWTVRKAFSIEQDVRRDPDGAFVAVLGNDLCGFITTWHDQQTGVGYIPNLAVASHQQGKGLGRSLIQKALDHFDSLGLTVARIETLTNNAAGNHLYRGMGFEEIAQQIHFGLKIQNDGPPDCEP
ncbi:putative acetyltransferase [Rubripirellula lacrimiformis]|uniref:Putative acetyltransferase n=1 Tax=Rubripirellula lacrimiformis TaxID=1930273 RepID=A0A517N4V6_9BACT|nr:N-acetyltransferase [Rubripirellula lacrimiformis]QDT02167.1 putative acetyltransferase [Rubripirellula lacrimiformis]